MKISVFSSTLSCISKCIRFLKIMINKKIIFGLFIISFLGACATPTALLGPIYTFGSSGSALQAGVQYGSGELVKSYTGKTPIENLKDISLKNSKSSNKSKDEKNIKKETLESDDFYKLVKSKIEKTSGILKLSSQ